MSTTNSAGNVSDMHIVVFCISFIRCFVKIHQIYTVVQHFVQSKLIIIEFANIFLCIFYIYLAPPLHIMHFNFENVPIFSYLYLLTISHFFKSSPKILSIFLVKPSLYIITFIS